MTNYAENVISKIINRKEYARTPWFGFCCCLRSVFQLKFHQCLSLQLSKDLPFYITCYWLLNRFLRSVKFKLKIHDCVGQTFIGLAGHCLLYNCSDVGSAQILPQHARVGNSFKCSCNIIY